MLKHLGFAALLFCSPLSAYASPAPVHPPEQPILLDTVIATVDEKPITLRELEGRLPTQRKITLTEAASDQEAQALLDRMIFEEVLLAEAAAKKISVDDQEVDHYFDEVARRNGLSRDGLVQALEAEKKNIAVYRRQIKIDILQSRLGSSYLQGSGAVTKEEIKSYLEEHPELTQGGSQVKLSRILVSTESRADEEAKARAEEALAKLRDGDSFSSVASEYSDGPEAQEGGEFGLVAEKDLSPEIFDATMKLSDGEVSDVIKSSIGYQIFKLDQRITSSGDDEHEIEEEVKKRLAQGKHQSKLQSFFTTELFKNHTVERKI